MAKLYNFPFQTADSGLYRDVWSKIKAYPDNLVLDPLLGVQKAQKQNFIYITEVMVYQPSYSVLNVFTLTMSYLDEDPGLLWGPTHDLGR